MKNPHQLFIPFISEVEEFNATFGKVNRDSIPVVFPTQSETDFILDFIQEEFDELKQAIAEKDVVGVLDALCDITYVCIGNGCMTFGFKELIQEAYAEVHRSNMSKACKTKEEALQTIELKKREGFGLCHYEVHNGLYVVYRSADRKVMKSLNYSKPDLKSIVKKYRKEV